MDQMHLRSTSFAGNIDKTYSASANLIHQYFSQWNCTKNTEASGYREEGPHSDRVCKYSHLFILLFLKQ